MVALATVSSLAAQQPPKPATPPASQQLPPGIRWQVALPAPPAGPPVIANQRVFVSALPGLVVAYRLGDGIELWRQPLNPEQPIAAEGDRVFVAAGDAVHAYNGSDASVAWRTPTGKLTAPLLVKDGWVIAAAESKVFAIRASDGNIIWSRDSGPQRQRAAVSGDLLFVPLATGAVRAHDLVSGELRWEWRVGGAPAEPFVLGDRMYVGTTDKHFYCIEISDGDECWKFSIGAEVRTRAAGDGERVFSVALDNLVRAFGRVSGSQRWQRGVNFRTFEGPTVLGPAVAVAGPSGEIPLLNVQNGRPAGTIAFPEPLAFPPAFGIQQDAIVVAGISGGLSESWKLWLATPTSPAPSSPPGPPPPAASRRP